MEQRIKKYPTKGKYLLKGKKIIECTDLFEWAEWLKKAKNRIIRQETLKNGLWVSTIFLGIDYNFLGILGREKPILFETMVFEPLKKGEDFRNDLYQNRCSTWEEAMKMHQKTVEKFKNYKNKK